MPTAPGTQQQSRHFLDAARPAQHTRSHSYQVAPGPQLSPLATHSEHMHSSTPPSPTRTSMNGSSRPLYMPAVLRPNYEFPPAPLSKSPGGSSDSGASDTTLRRTNTGLLSLTGLGARLSRRSTMESRKSVEGEWNLDTYPEVRGQPTRQHWKVRRCSLRTLMAVNADQPQNSPTRNPPSVTMQPASEASTTLPAATTAASAATSFATLTPTPPFRSTRTPTSTRVLPPHAPATTASTSSRAGSHARIASLAPLPSQRLHRPCLKAYEAATPASKALIPLACLLPRTSQHQCRATGTGAPSE